MIDELLFIKTYKAAFEDSNLRSVLWDDDTIYLYLCVISLVVIGAWIAEKLRKKNGGFSKVVKFWFILSGVILSSILGLRGVNTGMDTIQYSESFEHALDRNAFSDSTIEPGWQLLVKLLRLIFPSSELFIFLVSTLTVYLVLRTIWKYKSSINVFISLLSFVGLYYFQAMNLMRIYLAMAILMNFFHYLLERKYKKYLLVVLLTSMLHFSSLIMLMIVIMLWLYQRSRLIAFITFGLTIAAVIPLSLVFEDYITLARYADYASRNESSRQIGIMLIFDYLPCFIFILYVFKNKIRGQWSDLLVVITMIAFLIRFVAYFISIAGRLNIHFAALYIILVPYFVNHVRLNHRKLYPITLFLLMIFAAIRIHFYFVGYLASDGIMPYDFVWNN
ncbi:EpsG family protein [Prevotellaceae bacterium HUN156]|nr:EpsG family protein [Prevotellaceae bacterium HUN156]